MPRATDPQIASPVELLALYRVRTPRSGCDLWFLPGGPVEAGIAVYVGCHLALMAELRLGDVATLRSSRYSHLNMCTRRRGGCRDAGDAGQPWVAW